MKTLKDYLVQILAALSVAFILYWVSNGFSIPPKDLDQLYSFVSQDIVQITISVLTSFILVAIGLFGLFKSEGITSGLFKSLIEIFSFALVVFLFILLFQYERVLQAKGYSISSNIIHIGLWIISFIFALILYYKSKNRK